MLLLILLSACIFLTAYGLLINYQNKSMAGVCVNLVVLLWTFLLITDFLNARSASANIWLSFFLCFIAGWPIEYADRHPQPRRR